MLQIGFGERTATQKRLPSGERNHSVKSPMLSILFCLACCLCSAGALAAPDTEEEKPDKDGTYWCGKTAEGTTECHCQRGADTCQDMLENVCNEDIGVECDTKAISGGVPPECHCEVDPNKFRILTRDKRINSRLKTQKAPDVVVPPETKTPSRWEAQTQPKLKPEAAPAK